MNDRPDAGSTMSATAATHAPEATVAPQLPWLLRPDAALHRPLDALRPWLLLGTRLYVAWQFLKSGMLKLESWESTLGLFQDEYRVPLLPPELAAYVGTAGELVFPLLLVAGFASRAGALGLAAVNALAVLSYSHVLLTEGFEAALAQHVLWGYMLAVLATCGPGALSLDAALARWRGAARS